MIVAGIDIGSRAAKAVIMNDGEILATAIRDTGPESVKTSQMLIAAVLEGTGLGMDDIDYTVATGYGRVLVPFAAENVSEISCHARGITWYFPSVRTILDMGGQDCKAISVEGDGTVRNFVMNDKCAGGTGRFLEMIAEVLNLPLTEIGEVSLESRNSIPFNTICAVFAKSDAIKHLRSGTAKSDILAGLNEAIATRCLNLLKRVGIESDFTITGGISKNQGMVATLRYRVGLEPLLCDDPQLVGALGAALFAAERLSGTVRQAETKVSYGYSDATGEYFITVDTGLCDGCGECVPACPANVLEMARNEADAEKAAVRDEVRRRLAMVCPGFSTCSRENARNCHSACATDAISHTW
jgi:predicted CoA-substrate-specific enzyme activase